jgi:hypothetical protein
MIEAFGWLQETQRWAQVFTTFSFADKDCVPLQVADMLAHEVYKGIENEREGRRRDQRKLLTRIALGPSFLTIKHGTRKDLEAIRDAFHAWQGRKRLEPAMAIGRWWSGCGAVARVP